MIHLILNFIFLSVQLIPIYTSKKEKLQKISDINVLLPLCDSIDCNKVYYTIHAEGGCYEWTVDLPGYIELKPIQSKEENEGCFHKVAISPTNNKSQNHIVWLVARDKKTNEQFKCKIGFGKITKLLITKKFCRMNVGEVAQIDVNAYDVDDNLFSSVKGYRFHWKISDGNVVHLLKLSGEKVKVGQVRLDVEKKYHSDLILLKGFNTGKVILTAEILEPDYIGINSDKRELYIIEPFQIYPSDPIYILPENKFDFDIQLTETERNTLKLVSVENRKFYSWKIDNRNCGEVENYGAYKSAKNICSTKIIATDTRIDNFNSTTNNINVVYPTALDMLIIEINEDDADKIFSHEYDYKKVKLFQEFEIKNKNDFEISNTWKLVVGRNYLIKNTLMYERHPIRYSLNAIKFIFDSKNIGNYIQDLICFHEQEVCLLKAIKITNEYVSLESNVELKYKNKNYKVTKNIKIFSEVKIEKFGRKNFNLPYLGLAEVIDISKVSNENSLKNETNLISNLELRSQELRLIVNGGTGTYLFNSENPEVVQIREEVLFGKNLGKTIVKVTDSEIPSNFDTIEIYINEVKDFHYIEERQEIELGSEFYVSPIGVQTSGEYDPTSFHFYTHHVFTNCTNIWLNTSLSLKDKNIKQTPINKLSNHQSVRKFLNDNNDLLTQKLKWLNLHNDKDNVKVKYLDYINYGLCESRGFLAENEGLIRLSFFTNIMSKKPGQITLSSSTKILANNNAKINVYSTISLISPKFEDLFTNELITKANLADPCKNKNFILAVGSGLIAKFSGGIVPWIEFNSDYIETIHYAESANSKTGSIENIKNKIKIRNHGIKEIYIECAEENIEKEIVVTIQNNLERSLPRPGKSIINLSIGCYTPKSLSIFFLGTNLQSVKNQHPDIQLPNMIKDETVNEVFTIPQKNGIEYYQKKNNVEIARVYAFDGNKRIFYNITSLTGNWGQESNSKKKLYSVLSEIAYNKLIQENIGGDKTKKLDKLEKFISPEYLHSYILFENEIAKFDLFYTTKNKLTHYVTLNLIDFPTLHPSNFTLYFYKDNSAEISIVNGSGDFDISLSNDGLADYDYSDIDRKIVITPIKQGVLYVFVKDNRINNNFRAIATVHISPIRRIELIGGGLLMVNKSAEINVRVYDNFDLPFEISQVKKMNLTVGRENSEEIKGLEFIFPPPNIIDKLVIKGLISDTYSVNLIDIHSNVFSNTIRIEVFDTLEVFPPSLLMVPGSSYTLSIRGGPNNEQHILRKYEILDKQIGTVGEKDPEVKALTVGKTTIRIVLSLNPDFNKFYLTKETEVHLHKKLENEKNLNNEGHLILAVEEIPIRVDFPDHISIQGGVNRKIYTKSTIRLYSALKLGDETFTYGIGSFNFDWSIDNTLIAKLRFFKNVKDECKSSREQNQADCSTKDNLIMSYRNLNPYNSLGVFLSTYGQGSIEVKLTITINYPNPYKWKKPNVFTRQEKILILDEIYVDMPEFYENIPNKSGLYLIPLDVDHDLHTNKNNNYVKYSLISQHGTESNIKENVLTISENGRVSTSMGSGMAHVLINQKVKENPAFIPVILPIFVADYYSLFAGRSYQLIDMEVGQDVILKIVLQHEYGLLFADGKFERLKLRLVESHSRIAKAELIDSNSKIKIRANSQGETNIILFHPKTVQILDVFQVSVYSSLILPENIYINIGGNINLLKKDEKRKLYLSQDSEWISDDISVIHIDSLEGKATGIREGSTNIHLVSKDRSKVKLSIKVHVVRVKNIAIDRSKLPQYLTDIKSSPYYQSEYLIPVTFYIDSSDNAIELSKDSTDHLNEIKQNLNLKCTSIQPEIFTAQDSNSKDEIDKVCILRIRDIAYDVTPPNNLDLSISVESKGEKWQDSFTYKNVFKLPFMSSFKIKNKITELTFSPNNRTQTIYVDNLKDVSVSIEDQSLFKMDVNSEAEDNFVKLYLPHSVSNSFKNVKLILLNRFTNQKEEIVLNYIHSLENESERIFFGLMKRDTLIDYITFIVLLVTIDRRRIMPGPNVSASRPPPGSGIVSAINMNK